MQANSPKFIRFSDLMRCIPKLDGVKNLLAYTCLCIYLLLGSGTVINMHFCKGELKQLRLYKSVAVCCQQEVNSDSEVVLPHCCDLESLSLTLADHSIDELPTQVDLSSQPRFETEPAETSAFSLAQPQNNPSRAGPILSGRLLDLLCIRLHYS